MPDPGQTDTDRQTDELDKQTDKRQTDKPTHFLEENNKIKQFLPLRGTPGVFLGYPKGAPVVIFFQVSASLIFLANILHKSSVCALLSNEMGDHDNNKEIRIFFKITQLFSFNS